MAFIHTPNQPIGPFFHFALTPDDRAGQMAAAEAKGQHINLAVRVLDREAKAVTNAMIELWQTDACGKYDHPADLQKKTADPSFRGFGRLASNEQGLCIFQTVKPGQAPGWSGMLQAPHINVSIYAPGLLRRAVTRIYFDGDPANDSDQVLALVPPDRRPGLMARKGLEPNGWDFDLYLAGPSETALFEI